MVNNKLKRADLFVVSLPVEVSHGKIAYRRGFFRHGVKILCFTRGVKLVLSIST